LSKFSSGGGEGVCHSSPRLCQGFAGAFSPVRSDWISRYSMNRNPQPRIHDPTVENAWNGWNWSR
jgi:hypothetical protein